MKEYIEKEAFKQYLLDLKKRVNDILPGQSVISGTTLLELIDRFPAADDVVEVVRCKDCKHWDKTWTNDWAPDYHYCPIIDGTRKGDFYCADAERRAYE